MKIARKKSVIIFSITLNSTVKSSKLTVKRQIDTDRSASNIVFKKYPLIYFKFEGAHYKHMIT